MKRLYLIGGTMGVGKTTIGQELKQHLPNSVFLDGDWCWDANPFKVTEETKKMVIENICYLLNNYLLCSEYENVIFCWVMHKQSIIDQILSKIHCKEYELINISLMADEETIKNRLLKDIKNGLRTSDVTERSIKRIPMYNCLNTIKINTCDKTISEIIKDILSI